MIMLVIIPNSIYASSENVIKVKKVALSIDEIFNSADNFVKKGNEETIDETELKNVSNFLYNLLLGVGIIVAVIVGIIIGMKYMAGSIEEKAELKQQALAYVISCIVIFGAFGIWKIVVNTLST